MALLGRKTQKCLLERMSFININLIIHKTPCDSQTESYHTGLVHPPLFDGTRVRVLAGFSGE